MCATSATEIRISRETTISASLDAFQYNRPTASDSNPDPQSLSISADSFLRIFVRSVQEGSGGNTHLQHSRFF